MNFLSFLLDASHWGGSDGIWSRLGEHLTYTVISVAIAAAIAIPLGILIGHTGRGRVLVIGLSNAARAIPTLGLLVLVVLLMSTGVLPVIIVLTILAVPPILTATAAGVGGADQEAVHAARALGMSGGQIVAKVEWPLALPLVVSGLRSATLQVVATATIAAYVTVGGLGRLVFDGISSGDYSQIFAGAVLVAVLSIVLDLALGAIGWAIGRRARSTRRTRIRTVPATA